MKTATVKDLKARLDAGQAPFVLDVREPYETALGTLPGAVVIPMGEVPANLNQLPDDPDAEVFVYCRSGGRSASVAAFLVQQGYPNATNLQGGVTAWQAEVDPSFNVG